MGYNKDFKRVIINTIPGLYRFNDTKTCCLLYQMI